MRAVLLRDRRETDEHAALLAEARHFAGLGRLLAGAAHDGNNLLTPLLGYCDLLLAGLPPGSDLERYAQEIERSARRTSDLLRRLLERSRGRPQELRPVLARLADAEGGFDEATRNHIRNMDVYLARLLDEAVQGRSQMTHELRSEIKMVARTIAAVAGEPRALSG
mgnify:CR=1 FL=1